MGEKKYKKKKKQKEEKYDSVSALGKSSEK